MPPDRGLDRPRLRRRASQDEREVDALHPVRADCLEEVVARVVVLGDEK
jgi:hypothetical protein